MANRNILVLKETFRGDYDLLKPYLDFFGFAYEETDSVSDCALIIADDSVLSDEKVMDAVKKNNVKLYPVDSEHSAIFQCLQGAPSDRALKKIILTASGGPFFNKTIEDFIERYGRNYI